MITRKKDVGQSGNGGHFARTKFAEADDDIGFDQPQERPRPMSEYLKDPRMVDMVHRIAHEEFARMKSKHRDYYPGHDADDLAQGIVERLIRQSNRIDAGETTARHTADPGRLIRRSIQNWQVDLYRSAYGRTSADDKAVRMLNERIDGFHEANGRKPSPRIVDEWADEIRSEWDGKKNRPKKNFHRLSVKHIQEEDGTIADWRASQAGQVTHTETEFFDREEEESEYGKRRSRIQDILDDGEMNGTRKATKAQRQKVIANAKLHVWGMYAAKTGAPRPQAESIDAARADELRSTLGVGDDADGPRRGQVMLAVKEWESGESNERTRALFAPFGDSLSRVEEQKVVDTVSVNERYAEGVYESALLGATRAGGRR